ncbi:sensor domain-containing diguanylate cyclase [Erythrobacter sp. SDW2]|uniref:GGDEF domain-containing protein n=1 Tax=Erythrobacter sp. SDW2 TaxID=2907154 RepID=UPI001F259296|nr:sensor domain-containing diguanylate cyclase [Erythrobacter sp. SDW2]UIP07650.1 sensor domain-containing diguanylate cyclase [Erythrobacter sp. SDW2]
MMLDFSAGELAQLCELVSGTASDILFKTDSDGFIVHASQGIAMLGEPLPAVLIPPRLQDLVAYDHLRAVEAELALAAAGNAERGWTEFRVAGGSHDGRWYAMRLVPARERDGRRDVLGILHDVHERRMLEDRLFTARMTDPLTGLTNRIAFDAMLGHVTTQGLEGTLALLAIDHFRAINHRLGHRFGDEVLAGFTEVLRTVMRKGDTVSRIGGSCFAVLLVDTGHAEASRLCHEVQHVFAAELRAGKVTLPLSASAGIAEFSRCAEDTLRRTELALVLGKNSGRLRHERPTRPAITRAPQQMLRRAG